MAFSASARSASLNRELPWCAAEDAALGVLLPHELEGALDGAEELLGVAGLDPHEELRPELVAGLDVLDECVVGLDVPGENVLWLDEPHEELRPKLLEELE